MGILCKVEVYYRPPAKKRENDFLPAITDVRDILGMVQGRKTVELATMDGSINFVMINNRSTAKEYFDKDV